MRWKFIVILLPFLAVAGCRTFSQPMNLPPQVKIPLTMRLPDKHELKAGQLVFHSDFELSADHRLVRELVAERDEVYRTTGLPSSNEAINVYLFADAESYKEFLKYNYPNVPARRAFFLETDT